MAIKSRFRLLLERRRWLNGEMSAAACFSFKSEHIFTTVISYSTRGRGKIDSELEILAFQRQRLHGIHVLLLFYARHVLPYCKI